jgi:hypothetical protein
MPHGKAIPVAPAAPTFSSFLPSKSSFFETDLCKMEKQFCGSEGD